MMRDLWGYILQFLQLPMCEGDWIEIAPGVAREAGVSWIENYTPAMRGVRNAFALVCISLLLLGGAFALDGRGAEVFGTVLAIASAVLLPIAFILCLSKWPRSKFVGFTGDDTTEVFRLLPWGLHFRGYLDEFRPSMMASIETRRIGTGLAPAAVYLISTQGDAAYVAKDLTDDQAFKIARQLTLALEAVRRSMG